VQKKCEDIVFTGEESDYNSGYNCFYPNQTLAHEDIRMSRLKANPNDEGYKNLRAKLEIGKNHKDEFEDVSIHYVWTGNQTLNVDLFYSGGTTNLWLSQKNNGVETTVIFYAD
jgi:hypothetical protein